MAPLLIDSRDLLKFVLVSVVAVITVFVSGVFVGHQRAITYYQAGSYVYPLPLPERTAVAENAIESQLPVEVEAGEFIDVDHPVSSVKPVSKGATAPAMMSVPTKVTAKQKNDKAVTAKIKTQYKDDAVSEVETSNPSKKRAKENSQMNAANTEKHVFSVRPDTTNAAVDTSVRTDNFDDIKYSVQVGVYGRLANAENMMKMLQIEQYEAYITDYTNRKNETRYNVRFGCFPDRKSALASLEKFKSDNNGDGYLVRFTADNIVNLAVAGKNVTPPVQLEDHEKASTPVVIPSDTATDKVSQAGVLTDTLIKTN